MLLVNQLVGFGVGGGGFTLLSQVTDYTGTTNIGDMTGGGGLAAAFNGTTSEAIGSSASLALGGAGSGYVGKAWAAAKTIGRFILYDPSNEGFNNAGTNTTFELYGKNGAPSSSTDGTLLFTTPAQGYSVGTVSYDTTATNAINISAPYTHHWIRCTAAYGAAHTIAMTEIIFYEWL